MKAKFEKESRSFEITKKEGSFNFSIFDEDFSMSFDLDENETNDLIDFLIAKSKSEKYIRKPSKN